MYVESENKQGKKKGYKTFPMFFFYYYLINVHQNTVLKTICFLQFNNWRLTILFGNLRKLYIDIKLTDDDVWNLIHLMFHELNVSTFRFIHKLTLNCFEA